MSDFIFIVLLTTTNHQPVPMPTMMQCHQCIFFIKMHPNHQPVPMPTMMQESTGSCNVSGWGTLHSGLKFVNDDDDDHDDDNDNGGDDNEGDNDNDDNGDHADQPMLLLLCFCKGTFKT